MQHLNDNQPCQRSKAITDFRNQVLDIYNIPKVASNCLVTIISRREYSGRVLERTWINEGEIMTLMQTKYASCTFRSIDFVNLTMEQQVQIVYESSMIIGMHGAGMVNVMWLREGMYVIEIFPRRKKRYGYRNMCQYLGCKYFEYRGGYDIGHLVTKRVQAADWVNSVDPIFVSMIQDISH